MLDELVLLEELGEGELRHQVLHARARVRPQHRVPLVAREDKVAQPLEDARREHAPLRLEGVRVEAVADEVGEDHRAQYLQRAVVHVQQR